MNSLKQITHEHKMELDHILEDIERVDLHGKRCSLYNNSQAIFSKRDTYFYKGSAISLREIYNFAFVKTYPYESVNRSFCRLKKMRPKDSEARRDTTHLTDPYTPSGFNFGVRNGDYQKNEAIYNAIDNLLVDLKIKKKLVFVIPGDGCHPKTGLFLAMRFPDALVYSMDPLRRQYKFIVQEREQSIYNLIKQHKNLHSLASTWETFLCEHDFSEDVQYVIVMVHSHAVMSDEIFSLFPQGTLLVNMPCCVNNFSFKEPFLCYTDLKISYYARRELYIFRQDNEQELNKSKFFITFSKLLMAKIKRIKLYMQNIFINHYKNHWSAACL